jgi:putative selenium metabolism protein SsnA
VLSWSPVSLAEVDLRIEGGIVVEVGPDLPASNSKIIELGGSILMPGMINGHTHLYSSLALGMPAPQVENFMEALERMWWPLDRALDERSVYMSAMVGSASALLNGTTTIIDHHASPSFIENSLSVLAKGIRDVGARGVLAYEVTDRNGSDGAKAGIDECIRGIGQQELGFVRGMLGLHASFTASDDTLQKLADIDAPVHVHVAEGAVDQRDARERGYGSVLGRLDNFGILKPDTIVAHGVHLGDEEVEVAIERGCWFVHNPTSNRNNRVGYAKPARFGDRCGVGTDGIGSDMFAATRDVFFEGRKELHDVDVASFLAANGAMASSLLGVKLGTLDVGSQADIVQLNYDPATPMGSGNLIGHLLFGFSASEVRNVWVGGEQVVENGQLLTLNHEALMSESREVASELWLRYKSELEG